jgi:hypothetical protein
MLLCYILDIYLSFLFVCTESLTLVSDPTSRRFIGWLLFQTFIYGLAVETCQIEVTKQEKFSHIITYVYSQAYI